MKRRDIIRRLEAAGCELREGTKHTLVFREGVRVSAIPRDKEINTPMMRAIERQTGVKLREVK
jgi:hypothetical protein